MKNSTFLFFVLLLFSSCGNEELFSGSSSSYLDYMPEKTTEGNNTFGCYEDGRLVAVQGFKQQEGRGVWYPPSWVNAIQVQSQISGPCTVYFVLIIPQEKDRHIYIKSLNIKRGINRFSIAHDHKDLKGDSYYYEVLDSVDVNITYLDESQHIVCGEFDEAVLFNRKNKDDVIILTDGWFDVKYGNY